MINIGQRNMLEIARFCDFGAYLREPGGKDEILLPMRYLTEAMSVGDMLDVFVYTDSEDRPVATTDAPLAQVGDIAVLEVVGANRFGAFRDWGLPKDLLVPHSEQRARMQVGRSYPVYIYLDNASQRVAASAKIGKFIGNLYPELKRGEEVTAVVYERNEVGFRCAVNSLHQGIIYADEAFRPIHIGDTLTAYVKLVRPDGKIDLTLSGNAADRTRELADRIEEALRVAGGHIDLGDNSDPDDIRRAFQCSKKDFKKAIGLLLKTSRATRDSFA